MRIPLRLLLRAATLEASWEPGRMQGLGVLYVLLPVLRRDASFRQSLQRHAAVFNMNVWTAPLVLGSLWRLESEGRGAEAGDLRGTLSPPLSAAGDRWVWRALRPALLAAALASLAASFAWGVAAAFGIYALLLGRSWFGGFAAGVRLGASLPQHPSAWRRRGAPVLQAAGLFLGGWLLGSAGTATAAISAGAALGVGLLAVVGYTAARRQVSPGTVFLFLVALYSLARRVHLQNPVGLP